MVVNNQINDYTLDYTNCPYWKVGIRDTEIDFTIIPEN